MKVPNSKFILVLRFTAVFIILICALLTLFAAGLPHVYAQTVSAITGVKPVNVDVKAETLTMAVGALFSLLFSYFPKLNTWYAALEKDWKSLIMILLLLLTAAVIYFGSCLGLFQAVSCDSNGIWVLAQVFLFALMANQSTFSISPPTSKVEAAKLIAKLPKPPVIPPPIPSVP